MIYYLICYLGATHYVPADEVIWLELKIFDHDLFDCINSIYLLSLSRMIDWLSWPLAQHVDTWVIALLKGLAAVQKFTILIDVTLLKIELVCSENSSF